MAALLVTQFFGAYNDNAWKMIVITLGSFALKMRMAADSASGGDPTFVAKQQITTYAFCVFAIPMMLFSLPAGTLADRFSKRSVILAMKALEVVLMGSGLTLLVMWPTATTAMLVVLGLMGAQSALFSPAKYGIMPELLPHEKLSSGNGLLEMWTMLAIIAGTAAGTALLHSDEGHGVDLSTAWIAGIPLAVFAVVGVTAAWQIPRVPPARSGELGPVQTMVEAWSAIRADRVLQLTIAGNIVFWLIISMLGQNAIVYTQGITEGMKNAVSLQGLPLGVFGIGLAVGAIVAGRVSGHKVEYGLIPLGTVPFAIVAMIMAAWQPGFLGTCVVMGLMGACSGLIVVPLNAILQWRAPKDKRGAVLAIANVFINGGTILGTLSAFGLASAGFDAGGIFFAGAIVVLGATIWAIWLLPSALVRLALLLMAATFYRIRSNGVKNVPAEGGALLVPNHVTFTDGLYIMGCIDRPVRFLVYDAYYNKWWMKPIMKAIGAIPINSSGGPRVIMRALKDAGKYIDDGEIVCIFPEGQLSRTGQMMPFARGLSRIVKGRDAPIIPVHLDQAWGSIFSFKGGKYFLKLPEKLPYRLTVSFGEALPPDTPIPQVRQAVEELGTLAWEQRLEHRPPVHRTYIRSARRRPLRFAFADPTRKRVSRISALAGAIALARALRDDWGDQRRVGVMLPPSVASATTNIAAAIAGRTSVNLNFTAGQSALASAAKQAELRTVVTSRAFLEKAKIELPDNVTPIYLEDVKPRVGGAAKLTALLLAMFAPCRTLERACGCDRVVTHDDELTIIFSSGSTGEPKGVVLTHGNIDSNVEGIAQVFQVRRGDKLLGILPHFHSFGYMTMWFAANHGMGIVFNPNPLDPDAIGRLIARYRVTILMATPTFLQLYLRRVDPHDFSTLRVVLTGAEKLPDRLVEAFEQRFGLRPIEGYGTTECAPVIATSTLDVRYDGVFQSGSRRGSVGQPLPGVSVRIVDPDTFEPVPVDEPGMLLVKGPNVMPGYLNRPDLTDKAFRDGWYITGDIAIKDPDGFIRITDRLSRFSKIGGEMVPHGKVEEALHDAAELQHQAFAVTAIPDEKKGERLAVLHTWSEKRIPELIGKLQASGLPNLFIPRENQFVKVDELPMLGTGKLDLRELKRIAQERLGGDNAAPG
ncbi:MAG: MFS transporter [Phycisphaera sp.]|nr:MFS transporter [Phycisphaera sp.]